MEIIKIAEALQKVGNDLISLAGLLEADPRAALKEKPETAAGIPAAAKKTAGEMEPAKAPEPEDKEPEKKIRFEDIRGMLAGKAAAGYKNDVKNLLKKHSLSCLSDIEKHPDLFPEIYEESEAIGNA